VPQVKREFFTTDEPIVTFDHKGSLYGLRRWNKDDRLQEWLDAIAHGLDRCIIVRIWPVHHAHHNDTGSFRSLGTRHSMRCQMQ
jgi:hypothetical protein